MAYENPFDASWTWQHRARQKADESTVDYTVWAYTKAENSNAYKWKMTSSEGSGSAEKTGLTNTSYAWSYVTGFAISCTADDTLTFEIDTGANKVYVGAISVVEGTHSP